jgi:hypothetical protein
MRKAAGSGGFFASALPPAASLDEDEAAKSGEKATFSSPFEAGRGCRIATVQTTFACCLDQISGCVPALILRCLLNAFEPYLALSINFSGVSLARVTDFQPSEFGLSN